MVYLLNTLNELLSCDLAIDLGSTNTLIYQQGCGIVVNEPSVIAHKRRAGEVVNVKPVQGGAVADFPAAREMLTRFLSRTGAWYRKAPRVVANAPARASQKEKNLLRELILAAGAREVHLIEEPRAVALGAGLDFSGERCRMIVDIGGGITEMAVLAEGKVVRASALPLAGEEMDRVIAAHVKKRHRLLVDDHTAEEIKIRIGNSCPALEELGFSVSGRRLDTGLPDSVNVTAREISNALDTTIRTIVNAIQGFLRSLSPQQSVDLIDGGIVLAGGGSLLRDLDRLLERELRYPFLRVPYPLTCVVRGTGDVLPYLDQLNSGE
jgi:rod shape-determining protein MreB